MEIDYCKMESSKISYQDDICIIEKNIKGTNLPLNIKSEPFSKDYPSENENMILEKQEGLVDSKIKILHEELNIKDEQAKEGPQKTLLEVSKILIFNSNKADTTNYFTCDKCLYTNTKLMVKRHTQRVHVTTTKHSCPLCELKDFKEPLSLESHILNRHSDTNGYRHYIKRKIFECSFCNYKSLKSANFARHLRTHTESKLKKCLEENNNVSLDSSDSKEVIRKALSSGTFDCFHCPYKTNCKGSIIKHVRLHRGNINLPHSCKDCKKRFNEKNSLDAHIVKNHIENKDLLKLVTNKVYECELCNYKDVNKNKIIRHKAAKHVKQERKKKRTSKTIIKRLTKKNLT